MKMWNDWNIAGRILIRIENCEIFSLDWITKCLCCGHWNIHKSDRSHGIYRFWPISQFTSQQSDRMHIHFPKANESPFCRFRLFREFRIEFQCFLIASIRWKWVGVETKNKWFSSFRCTRLSCIDFECISIGEKSNSFLQILSFVWKFSTSMRWARFT